MRKKINEEPKYPHVLPKKLSTITCKKYGEMRHNINSYKDKRAVGMTMPKGGNKKKKAKNLKEGNEKISAKEKVT